MTNEIQETVFYVNKAKALAMTLAFAAGAVLAAYLLSMAIPLLLNAKNTAMDYAINGFFGLLLFVVLFVLTRYALLFSRYLFGQKLLIAMGPEGVRFPRLGLIPWTDVDRLEIFNLQFAGLVITRHIGIYLRDIDSFLARFNSSRTFFWKRDIAMGYPHLVISGVLSPVSAQEMMDKANELRGQPVEA